MSTEFFCAFNTLDFNPISLRRFQRWLFLRTLDVRDQSEWQCDETDWKRDTILSREQRWDQSVVPRWIRIDQQSAHISRWPSSAKLISGHIDSSLRTLSIEHPVCSHHSSDGQRTRVEQHPCKSTASRPSDSIEQCNADTLTLAVIISISIECLHRSEKWSSTDSAHQSSREACHCQSSPG